ncbi:MAG: hypothetical protein ACPGQV_10125 [Alphaproteobacteria bacterium]
MTEAQTLEKEPHIERVCVVGDQYNLKLNVSRDTVIYETVLAGDAQKKSGKGAKGRVGSSGGYVDYKRKGKKAAKQGQVKSRAQREAAKAMAKKEKCAQEIEAQRSNEPSAVAMAVSNAVSSAAATVTRARQLIGKRPNQEQLASGMVKLAVAICGSTIISFGLAVGVFHGLDAVHQSGVFSFQSPKTFGELVIAGFILTFAGSFVPIIRKVSFGSSPRAAAQAQSA